MRPAIDPDLWWHLRTGQLTLQNHAVFRVDPFSFTRAGQSWINHEWLSDVLMFGLYRFSGLGGLVVAFAFLIAAAYLLTFRRCAGQRYVASIATIWAAIASRPVWGVRPQVLSLFLASLLLVLYDASLSRSRRLWWAVPLMLLWVNLHAGYALGIALLVLFVLGDVAEVVTGSESWTRAAPRLRIMASVIAACIAVVPLNPYGTKLYWYPVATLRSVSMQSKITEWFSPNFHDPQYLPLALLMLASIVALAVSPRLLRPGELLLLLVVSFLTLLSVRHVGVYALIAAPILSKLLDDVVSGGRRRQSLSPKLAAFINVAVLALFGTFVALHIRTVVEHQPQAEAGAFPIRAVGFLTEQRPPGPILNDYDWGGYLIWRLYPEYRVFIDGRADVYGDSLMKDFGDANSLTGDWRSVLDRWKIRTVILRTDSPLVTALRTSRDWKQLYSDSQATVVARVDAR